MRPHKPRSFLPVGGVLAVSGMVAVAACRFTATAKEAQVDAQLCPKCQNLSSPVLEPADTSGVPPAE